MRPQRPRSHRQSSRHQISDRPHSQAGGRHELGQNFLRSRTTIATIVGLTRATTGSILEIGPGTGAVTAELYRLGRPLTPVEIDETRIAHLEHRFPQARVEHADALRTRFDAEVIVGNLPSTSPRPSCGSSCAPRPGVRPCWSPSGR